MTVFTVRHSALLLIRTLLSDIFEEGNQIDQNDQKKLPEFSDVYGLMSYHGVPKPGWRAFALLHSQSATMPRLNVHPECM